MEQKLTLSLEEWHQQVNYNGEKRLKTSLERGDKPEEVAEELSEDLKMTQLVNMDSNEKTQDFILTTPFQTSLSLKQVINL